MSRNSKKQQNYQNIGKELVAKATDNSAFSIFSKILELSSANNIDFSRKNIKKWRAAMESFLDNKNPSPAELQDIYTDFSFDAHLQSQLMLRKMNILNAEFAIYNDKGEKDEEASLLFNRSWFYQLLNDFMDAIFFGATIIEFYNIDRANNIISYNIIPRRNTIIAKKLITLGRSNTIDYSTPEYQNWILQLGTDNMGVMNNIMAELIWKRHTTQSWATFIDRFGLPWITVTTNKTQKKDLDGIEEKANNIGQGFSSVLPTGTMVDLKQPQNTDAYNVFMSMITLCESQISKQIVGGTMISDNGSSRSQSEVHERNLTDRISIADMRSFAFFVNDLLIPLLNLHGFKLPQGFTFDTTKDVALKDIFTIVQGLSNQYEIDQDWISKTFNIPITGKRALPIDPNSPPSQVGGSSSAILKKKSNNMTASAHTELPALSKVIIGSYDSQLKRLQEILALLLPHNEDYNAIVAQKAVYTYNILSKVLLKSFKGIDTSHYYQPDYQCYQAMQMNIFQFSAAKQIHLAQQMNAALLDDNGVRRSFADFKKQADNIGVEYDINFLNTEYNFATAVGQNASNYWAQQKDKEKIPFVMYQTAGDNKVRDTHASLNGKIFSLDDPFLSRIYPPNGWGCRCELVQYPQGSASNASQAASLINQADIKPEFQINRAIAKEVFSKNQAYLKTISNGDIEKLNDLQYSDYNRPNTIKGNSPLGTPKEVTPEFDKNNKAVYKDYLGRQVVLDKSNYIQHTTEQYKQQDRHLYASKIQEVLEHPTEVYLKYYNNQPSMRYIKYYDNGTSLIVQTGFENDTHIVGTWFKNDKGNDSRQGYLIKYSNE